MANQSQHAGTIADPIPQRLLYKKGDKVYTVATGPSTSGPTTDVVEATDTRKGITRLSDSITSTSDAATGVTAATPLAVKYVNDKVTAVEEKNVEQDQRLTAIENKNLDTDKKLTGIEETLTDHAGRIDALENAGGGSTIVLVPRITSPAQNEVNVLTTFTITGSPYQTLLEGDKRKHRVFELSKSKSFDSLVWTKSVDADSAEVTPPVDESTDFYIRIKDESQQGYTSPWSTVTKITSGGPTKVSNPTVSISGDAQAAKANPTFTGSEFAIEPSDQNDPSEHVSTTWTLRKIDGNLLVWQSTDDIINKTSLTLSVGTLNVSTKYKMEMQYTSKSHGSSAVATVEFTTAAEFTKVKTPTVSIEGGADTVYETPVIKGGAFATTVVEDVDTHKSSTWWITKKVGGAEVFRLDNSTDALTSVTVPKGRLEVSTQYVAHVIYTGTTYGASAEATLEFTTADEFTHIKTPTISIDGVVGTVGGKPTFRGTAFTIVPSNNSDTHTASTWWITRKSGEEVYRLDRDSSKLTIMTVPDGRLDPQTDYVVHLIYHGITWGDSNEATLSFRTAEAFTGIRLPHIKIDNNGDANNYNLTDGFVVDDYVDYDHPNNPVTRVNWELYNGDSLVWSSEDLTYAHVLASFNSSFKLNPSTKYKLRYRHGNSASSMSDWSEIYFTTASVLKPASLCITVKDSITLSDLLPSDAGWSSANVSVFVDGIENADIINSFSTSYPLSSSGSKLEIIRTDADDGDYKRINFGAVRETLLSVDKALPKLSRQKFNKNFSINNTWDCGGFGNCTQLVTIAEDLFKFNPHARLGGYEVSKDERANITSDCYGCFSNCTSLRNIPPKLLHYLSSVSNYNFDGIGAKGLLNCKLNKVNGYGTFANCTSLTTIPSNLFKYCQYVYLSGRGGGAFESGSAEKHVQGGNGYGCFYNCIGLKQIQSNFFSFDRVISSHSGTKSFSAYGSGAGVIDFSYVDCGDGYGAFANCTGLTKLCSKAFTWSGGSMDPGISLSGAGGDAGCGYASYSSGNSNGGDYNTGGNGYGCFYNCTALTTIEEDFIYCATPTDGIGINTYGWGADAGCGDASTFDTVANGGNHNRGGDGYGAFANCTSLHTLGRLINYTTGACNHSGRGGDAGSCGSAQFDSKGSGGDYNTGGNGYGCFYNCTALTTLPESVTGTQVSHWTDINNSQGGQLRPDPTGQYHSGSNCKGGNCYGMFGNCTSLSQIDINVFKGLSRCTLGSEIFGHNKYAHVKNDALGINYGVFGNCSRLTVVCRFDTTHVDGASGRVGNFAANTAGRGTVYVPRGSKIASDFKNDPTANVNVIEEDMA